jgi:hypothetical protein
MKRWRHRTDAETDFVRPERAKVSNLEKIMAGEFIASLAVLRAKDEDATEFRSVFSKVIVRLLPLFDLDYSRWEGLITMVLEIAIRYRSQTEWQELSTIALTVYQDASQYRDVSKMIRELEERIVQPDVATTSSSQCDFSTANHQ